MNKIFLFTVGLLCTHLAFGAAQPCDKELSGKTACVVGEMMLCNKEFNPTTHDFRYEWHGINNIGQSFDIYLDSMYKKVPGLTPATCSNSPIKQGNSIKPTAK